MNDYSNFSLDDEEDEDEDEDEHLLVEDFDDQLILHQLDRFICHNNPLKIQFVDDIHDFFEKNRYITSCQQNTLKKIYDEYDVRSFIEMLDA